MESMEVCPESRLAGHLKESPMRKRSHHGRHGHLGVALAKLVLDIGAAVVKKKIMERDAACGVRMRDKDGRSDKTVGIRKR